MGAACGHLKNGMCHGAKNWQREIGAERAWAELTALYKRDLA
jgi:hypothetical protein